ncbi:MAG: hypothetical protein LBR34_09515 [Prevotella sp.]|jgi:N-acetylglucosamine kinase-like BadF-type ATPase|nr:hypothetical protein [Prevotella sp.]
MTILIADSGSTTTEWRVAENGCAMPPVFTDGFNPFLQTGNIMRRILTEQLPPAILGGSFDRILFYGAGCIGVRKEEMKSALAVIQAKEILVESDMYAAARSLLGNTEGIACILGTGSNSCHYNGKKIIKNVPPLGYLLGDEGGGAALGRMFLSDCLKGLAPQTLAQEFFDSSGLTCEDVLEKVYKQPFPNRFLAGLSPFLAAHTDNRYVRKLVSANFRNFFSRCILQYDYKNLPLGFVGSIAFYYSRFLHETADEFGISIAKITKSPVDGLIAEYCR